MRLNDLVPADNATSSASPYERSMKVCRFDLQYTGDLLIEIMNLVVEHRFVI